MPNALVVGDILELVVASYLGDQVGENVFHARVATPLVGTPTDVGIVQAFDALAAPLWKVCLASAARYRGVSLRILRAGSPFAPVSFTGSDGPGSEVSPPQGTQVRGLISWKTALAGRAYRGRTYIPFPTGSQSDIAGDPTAAYKISLAGIRTLISTSPLVLTQAGQTANIVFGIYHRNDPVPPATAPLARTITDITDGRINVRWATQRRSGGFGRTNSLPF